MDGLLSPLEIATEAAEAMRNILAWMSPTYDSNNNSKYDAFIRSEAYMSTRHCQKSITFSKVGQLNCHFICQWSHPTYDTKGAVPNTTMYCTHSQPLVKWSITPTSPRLKPVAKGLLR